MLSTRGASHLFGRVAQHARELRKSVQRLSSIQHMTANRALAPAFDKLRRVYLDQENWVHPLTRAMERTFACMSRRRRLAKDYGRGLESAVAWAQLAACRFVPLRVGRAVKC